MQRVAFIDVGRIGAPMALRIAGAGHRVAAFDRDYRSLDAELRRRSTGPVGARVLSSELQRADSAAEAVADADVVCVCLPGPAEAEELLLGGGGSDGLVASLRDGAALVDHTTNEPQLSKRIHEACASRADVSVAAIDAPVSGGVESARLGELTMLVGAEDSAVVERARPVLETMATHVGLCGGPVSAATVGLGCDCR